MASNRKGMENIAIVQVVKSAYKALTWLETPCEYFTREMTEKDGKRKNRASGFPYINNPCDFIVGFICKNEFVSFHGYNFFSGEDLEKAEGETFSETMSRRCTDYKISHLVVHESDHQDCYAAWGERYICTILSLG